MYVVDGRRRALSLPGHWSIVYINRCNTDDMGPRGLFQRTYAILHHVTNSAGPVHTQPASVETSSKHVHSTFLVSVASTVKHRHKSQSRGIESMQRCLKMFYPPRIWSIKSNKQKQIEIKVSYARK